MGRVVTHGTAKTLFMPLCPERLYDCLCDWFFALFAAATIPILVAADTPGVPILFYKLGLRIEWLKKVTR
jgi:hypothetical protein